MRFLVSTFCLTLVGFSPVLGAAQETHTLPHLGSSTSAANGDGSVELATVQYPAAQYPLGEAPVAQPSRGFNDVFDSAISQFSGERVANRTVADQGSEIVLEELQAGLAPQAERQTPGGLEAMSPLSSGLAPETSVSTALTDTPLPKDPVMRTESAFPSTPHESIFSGVGQLDSNAGETPSAWKIPKTDTKKMKFASSKKSLPGWSDLGDRSATDHQKDKSTASSNGWSQPAETLTWWKMLVNQPIDATRSAEPVDSNSLVYRALQNSPRIQAISQTPLIRELQIVEADSEFDAVQYVQSQFEDRVDPVGNELTVGNGENFLKDNIWTADAGFRKKARNGAQWELNQRLGFQNSNSNFFVPQDQGTATLALNVTQPLMRGRGKYYNESQILIAQATNGAAWQSFQSELQDELLGVMSGYWDLYLTRSIYLQKLRNVERGQKILDRLEGRKGLDSLPSQIARARSSVQTRRTELANTARDVLNAETEIRRRIADSSWMNGGSGELIPAELPTTTTFEIPLEQVVYSAIEHRPEIHEAMNQLRIASVQRDVSANELLPELSLLMGTYVSALRGDTGIGNAFQDQFGQVKPGYSFGINFELPYGNRALAVDWHSERSKLG